VSTPWALNGEQWSFRLVATAAADCLEQRQKPLGTSPGNLL